VSLGCFKDFNDLATFSLERHESVELVPVPNSTTHAGILPLAVARQGIALELKSVPEDQWPTIDLVRAGIGIDCRPAEAVRESARDYLEDKRFVVRPSFNLDFDFFFKILLQDPALAICYRVKLAAYTLQGERPFVFGRFDEETARKESNEFFAQLQETVTLGVEGEPVSGVNLLSPMTGVRSEIFNLLIPKSSPEHAALVAVADWAFSKGRLNGEEEKLKKLFEEEQGTSWANLPKLARLHFAIRRAQRSVAAQRFHVEGLGVQFKSALAVFA